MKNRIYLENSKRKKITIVNSLINLSISNELEVLKQLNYSSIIQTSKTRRKLCLYTGRARAVRTIIRGSRHFLLKFQRSGILFGIKKHGW